MFIIGEFYEFCVFLSTVPLLFICNSLLNAGMAEKEQEEYEDVPDRTSAHTSIQDPNSSKLMLFENTNELDAKTIQSGVIQQDDMRLSELITSYKLRRDSESFDSKKGESDKKNKLKGSFSGPKLLS